MAHSASSASNSRELSLSIEGMTCASCVARVERVLSRVSGVSDVRVNLATERANLRAAPEVTAELLAEVVEKAGYHVAASNEQDDVPGGGSARPDKSAVLRRKVWLSAALSLPVVVLEMGGHLIPALHHWLAHTVGTEFNWSVQMVLTALVLFGPGRGIVAHGWRALGRRAPDMNSLVAVGTSSAFGYSVIATTVPTLLPAQSLHVYFEAAAAVITLVLVGRYLEARAKGQTSRAIERLIELAPEVALVERDGTFVQVDAKQVVVGDRVLLKPGMRVPVDGVVVEGESHVDESMLTGEPTPAHKTHGALLRAGTVNQSGSVTLRATAVGKDTVLAQIVHMVESAQASKLPIQSLVDRVTLWFVPVVMGLAALTFVVWFYFGPEPSLSLALVNAVAVLIIACPCAMGLATPTSILVGTGRGAELGLLFRHGEALERLRDTKVVVFDKTGTLTEGQPTLTDWVEMPAFPRERVLPMVAALESRSEHPIARAVVTQAQREQLNIPPVTAFENMAGVGISATVEGARVAIAAPRHFAQSGTDLSMVNAALAKLQHQAKTTLVATINGEVAAVFAVSDPLKNTAREAIRILQAQGLRVAMVTGDNQGTALAVARDLNIQDVRAEVLPAGKVAAVKELQREFGTTAFVGDGINDAPVLAEADVGVAMGTGTDVAIEAADVVLMRDDLNSVPAAIALSRAVLRNIRQNLFWAFFYNTALIPIAAGILYPSLGILLSPVLASVGMAMSSVFVLGNALRLKAFRDTSSQGARRQPMEAT